MPPVIQLTPEEEDRRQELLWAATGYAQMGWRVMPLCWVTGDGKCGYGGHNSKTRQCASPGKVPILKDWVNVATSKPELVAQWWNPPEKWDKPGDRFDVWYPHANIGVVCGAGSGIFVTDVDPERGGDRKLDELQADHGELPLTRVHHTGGDGEHWIWKHPGFKVRNIRPWGDDVGLDIKGDGGMIVVPPSRSHKGPYTVSAEMEDIAPAEAPEWILELLRRDDAVQRGDRVQGPEVLPTGLISKYIEAAKKDEYEMLRNCPRGARNDQLNMSSFALGTLGAHGLVDEDEARILLEDACRQNGYIQQDGMPNFLGTFSSGWKAGLKQPRNMAKVGKTLISTQQIAQTDIGLGERFVAYYGDRILRVNRWNAFMFYGGGVWQRLVGREGREEAEVYAQEMIRKLMMEEERLYSADSPGKGEKSDRQKYREWRLKQETPAHIGAAITCGCRVPLIRRKTKHFDSQPWLLATTNGVIDMETMELREHNPGFMITMQATVAYDPKAPCSRWQAFLDRVQPDPQVQAFLQRTAALSATNLNPENAFFIHYGLGANGKSVYHSVMEQVLGTYAQTVPVEALLASGSDRIPNDIARMEGRRYLIAPEPKAGKPLDLARLKQLTGGDTIAARFLRGEYFEFRNYGKIHMTANHLPRILEIGDEAAWRRINVIPWEVQIPPHERDRELARKLYEAEGSGVLAWIVRGAMGLMNNEFLQPPELVIAAKSQYQKEEDHIGLWADECVIETGSDRLLAGGTWEALYASYQFWTIKNGFKPVNYRNWRHWAKVSGWAEVRSHKERGAVGRTVQGGVMPT